MTPRPITLATIALLAGCVMPDAGSETFAQRDRAERDDFRSNPSAQSAAAEAEAEPDADNGGFPADDPRSGPVEGAPAETSSTESTPTETAPEAETPDTDPSDSSYDEEGGYGDGPDSWGG